MTHPHPWDDMEEREYGAMAIQIGNHYVLDYPAEFTTLPEYTARNGELVMVTRPLSADEADISEEPMFEVVASDGWTGHVWRSELKAA